jgi:acyl transferase domain-containing protein
LAQEKLIRGALQKAGLTPADIDLVEAHGTGTALGDPIELDSLSQVFRDSRGIEAPLVIGSVKTNIGHLEAASGIAGLIKVILALQHEMIPPHLHLRTLNPSINLEQIPAIIPTATMPWLRKPGRTRRAGVSSFGLSGTNAHVILEEPPVFLDELEEALP